MDNVDFIETTIIFTFWSDLPADWKPLWAPHVWQLNDDIGPPNLESSWGPQKSSSSGNVVTNARNQSPHCLNCLCLADTISNEWPPTDRDTPLCEWLTASVSHVSVGVHYSCVYIPQLESTYCKCDVNR